VGLNRLADLVLPQQVAPPAPVEEALVVPVGVVAVGLEQ